MLQYIEHYVLVNILLPVSIFVGFPTAVSNCIDGLLDTLVLQFDLLLRLADAPNIGSMRI
jgi:hypothetical protein